MSTTINATQALIAARTAAAPKKPDGGGQTVSERPQQTEAYSSTYSSAARSLAMAGINFSSPVASAAPAAQPQAAGVSYTEGISCKVVSETTGDATNQWWKEEMGYENPPYLPESTVQQIELTEDTTFCRVYDGENSGMYGGWLMKQSDLEGLTPEQIQDKYALPQKPIFMCDVTVPAGTQMRTGLCNPLDGWGQGGGVQFDLMGQRVGQFGNERNIPT